MQNLYQFQRKYQYYPLSLFSLDKANVKDAKCELRRHRGRANYIYHEGDDIKLAPDSLIYQGKIDRPKLLICITMYNEPFSQLVKTLAGVYRSYYEL